MEKRYDITGMTCSACSSGIERTVSKLEGVTSCEVSLIGKSMKVDYDPAVLSENDIMDAVTGLGYGIYYEGEAPRTRKSRRDIQLLVRFIVSVVFLVPLMTFSMCYMFGGPVPAGIDPDMGNGQWFCLVTLILSAVVIGINYEYFTRGIKAVFKKVPNMDTLVCLGSGVSFIYSLVLTILIFIGTYNPNKAGWTMYTMDLHFESAAMILALVDLGKWLEELSKKKTGDAVEKLLKLTPDTVLVVRDGVEQMIPVNQVAEGDILIVKQGEYIPVDGVITEGTSFVDKSAITGESLPVEVQEGDEVTSASLVTSGVIRIKALKVGDETTLSKIVKMVREAGTSKAPIQKFADTVAGVFVPVVVVIALVTFLVWLIVDGGFNSEHCVTYAINVLVVSCPCALGLATPVAIMTSTGKAASFGILYKDAECLQNVRDVNAILLDKTATITEGKPEVNAFYAFGMDEKQALRIACGIEKNSNHPLAKCVVAFAEGDGVEVQGFEYNVGKGAEAYYGGRHYLLGNERFISQSRINGEVRRLAYRLSAEGNTVIYLADERRVVALFSIADKIKTHSREAVELLKSRDIRVAMLTGDSEKTAKAVAASVGIDDYLAECMPEDKLKAVQNLHLAGGTVAMVGDGINDSPALKEADVGIAIGNGTDIAIDSAGVVLVGDDLRALDTVIDLSKATVRNIKENLFWAFIYNIIMIPVAAGCFASLNFTFSPWISAACMCVSSLFVVCNALRLLLYRNKRFTMDTAPEPVKEIPAGTVLADTQAAGSSAASAGPEKMKKTVYVEGMMCDHCVMHVTKAIASCANVESVNVSLEKGTAEITSTSPVSDDEIKKAVEDAGYTVSGIESLPQEGRR
ncbi:MAG: heavy metal translocating P-type ATPase [Clostridia bacterium]|nr:heavy metal translocating P-type ATPase [Clostridia bacterium]